MVNRLLTTEEFGESLLDSMHAAIKYTWPLVDENSEDYKNLIIGMLGCFSVVDNSCFKSVDENGFIKIDNGE